MTFSNAFITNDKIVIITCPNCNKITKIPLAKFDNKYLCKVRCVCDNIFVVKVDHRDKFRKKVDLPGIYVITQTKAGPMQKAGTVNWESVNIPNCRVIDISRSGICFSINDHQKIHSEDIIQLRFKLDNAAETEITQQCEIKFLKDNRVGCRMLSNNINLGFYLLS